MEEILHRPDVFEKFLSQLNQLILDHEVQFDLDESLRLRLGGYDVLSGEPQPYRHVSIRLSTDAEFEEDGSTFTIVEEM